MKRILAVSLMFAAGCTYGPVRERASVWVAEPRFNSHTFAVALDWERYRDPTGLSRFPDGGSPLSLREEARFFVCDVDSRSVRLLAAFPKTKRMESGFEGWIEGWEGDAVYVRVQGRRYSWRVGRDPPQHDHGATHGVRRIRSRLRDPSRRDHQADRKHVITPVI